MNNPLIPVMLNWIFNGILITLLCIVFYRNTKNPTLKPFFLPAIILKIGAGVLVGILYKYYYRIEGDTFYLFNLASYLAELVPSRFKEFTDIVIFNHFDQESKTFFFVWNQPRALFFVKILSFVNLISQSNYWLSSAYLSLFSFYGLWRLADYLTAKGKIPSHLALLSFMFLPSFVFWSSGILKETLMTGLMGIILVSCFQVLWERKNLIKNWIIILLCAVILFYLKYYYAVIFGGILFAYSMATIISKKYAISSSYTYLTFCFILIFSFLGASFLHPNMNLSYFPEALYKNYTLTLELSEHADYRFQNFGPTWLSIVQNLPQALFTGLFEPGFWSVFGPLQIIASLENFFILGMFIISLSSFLFQKNYNISLLAFAAIIYIFISASFMAFASPNFGSLIRYKTGFIPFFLVIIGTNNPVLDYFFQDRKY